MENNNQNNQNQVQENIGENQEQENKACCAELKQVKNNFIYLTAEFDNFKKRIDRERLEWINSSQSAVLGDILAIFDNFERAINQIQKNNLPEELKSHLMGFELIAKELDKFLKKYDITEVQITSFDPMAHEAIMQVETDKFNSGDIVEVFEKGYQRKGHILRPAKVSVAK